MSPALSIHPSVVDATVRARHSVRSFQDATIPKSVVEDILAVAARAPSGTNMQPWQVTVLDRPRIDAVADAISSSGILPKNAEWDDYKYYPDIIPEPFGERRRTVGASSVPADGNRPA